MKKKMTIILTAGMLVLGIAACGAAQLPVSSAAEETQSEEGENRKPLTDRFFAEIAAEWEQTRR